MLFKSFVVLMALTVASMDVSASVKWDKLSLDPSKIPSKVHYKLGSEMKTEKDGLKVSFKLQAMLAMETDVDDDIVSFSDTLDFGTRSGLFATEAKSDNYLMPISIVNRQYRRGELKREIEADFDEMGYELDYGSKVVERSYPQDTLTLNVFLRYLPQLPAEDGFETRVMFSDKTLKNAFLNKNDSKEVTIKYVGKTSIQSDEREVNHFAIEGLSGASNFYSVGGEVVRFEQGGSNVAVLMSSQEVEEYLAQKAVFIEKAKLKAEKVKQFSNKAYELIKEGNVAKVKKLYEKDRLKVNLPIKFNKLPLHLAAESNQPKLVKLFVEYGAEINRKAKYDRTALHAAVWGKSLEAVKVLVKLGADVNVKDANGLTPLVTSKRLQGRKEITGFLESLK